MIFASVGTQLPFPRLIDALDHIAGETGLEIVAQCAGISGPYHHIKTHSHLSPQDYETFVRNADRIVAHAGIGTVLAAARHRKPLIIFPRLASLGEHRNEHQMATAKELRGRPGLHVATDEGELRGLLIDPNLAGPVDAQPTKLPALIAHLHDFIHSDLAD